MVGGFIATLGSIGPGLLTGAYLFALGGLLSLAIMTVSLRMDEGYGVWLGVLIAVVAGSLFWAPVWQGIVYVVAVKSPGSFWWLFVGGFLALIGELMPEERETAAYAVVVSGLTIALLGFVFVGPMAGQAYAYEHMTDEIVEPNAEELDKLPDSSTTTSRIAPQAVSENWATNSLQYPRYNIEGGDITYINGTPHWSYSLAPDGAFNTFTRKQRGAVYVNQSSFSKDITVHDDQNFVCGEGMAMTDNVGWQISRDDYFKDYQDTFVVPHEGQSYLVTPYITHSWEFRLTPLPQFYAVPEFGGVKVVDQDCNIQDMSPDEAHDSEILGEVQNYYPYELAMFKVESMAYKNGILNTIIGHEEQLEVAGVPGQGNGQPFTVPTEDGIQYFIAAEPWGEANGVYQVWTIDAQTGEPSVQSLDQEDAYRGPRKAVDSVMAHPQLSRLNDVEAVEPIPVVRDGTLYWQVRVVPESSSRITYVAFFNADNEEVAIVESTNQVNAFLSGDQVNTTPEQQSNDEANDGAECSFTIVIEYEDGSTDTICVEDGESVTIEDGNSTSN